MSYKDIYYKLLAQVSNTIDGLTKTLQNAEDRYINLDIYDIELQDETTTNLQYLSNMFGYTPDRGNIPSWWDFLRTIYPCCLCVKVIILT